MLPNIHVLQSASCSNTKTRSLAIHAFDIEVLNQGKNDIPKDSSRIVWIKRGAGALSVDMRTHMIASDTIYYIRPGQTLEFDPAEHTEGYVISFSAGDLVMAGEDIESFYHSALTHPLSAVLVLTVEPGLKPEMIQVIERMISEYTNTYPGKQEILRWLLKIFLIYLNRHQGLLGQTPAHFTQSGLASLFFKLLEKNYASRKMVADYAQDLSVTPNYLNETVKKASGFPASYHIQQRIILEAKRKATHVRKSMKEIAYDLGFDDISHFSKYFKKVSGVSFSDFKKELSHQMSVTVAF